MSASPKIPSIVSKANEFHKKGITGQNVAVAVMDSGLFMHADFNKNRLITFQDFVENKDYAYDDYSHGTHVTGIIASSKIGIAPQSNIVSLKVLDKNGNGSTHHFIAAIKWLLANHEHYQIRIVNISIGGNSMSANIKNSLLNLWVSKLWEAGLIICCSAGNMGPSPNSITAPGNCPNVITVGSYDGKHFSSAGPLLPYITKPELVAPGLNILSTKAGGGYSTKNGTSMSVPFISGICALMLQTNPNLTNEQIKYMLMDNAYPVPYLPYNMQGAGVVDLQKLFHAL